MLWILDYILLYVKLNAVPPFLACMAGCQSFPVVSLLLFLLLPHLSRLSPLPTFTAHVGALLNA